MSIIGFESNKPLLDYAIGNLWGNPEENHQYQVQMVRLSDYYGNIDNFSYMEAWRTLPKKGKFYHVFSVGGLDPGFWNFDTGLSRRNPLERWVNLGDLCTRRGVMINIYNTFGFNYTKAKAWVMCTYDGLVLIALEKLKTYVVPADMDMFFRVYTPTVPVPRNETVDVPGVNAFAYETLIYEFIPELAQFQARYAELKAKPGFTFVYHNGAYFHGAVNQIPNVVIGDVVEIIHDPTVIRAELYRYDQLPAYYSEMDKVRKLILHPPKTEGDFSLRYFDDNDYFLVGPKNYGLYFHRNNQRSVRQLTHQDIAISDYDVQMASGHLDDLKTLANDRILVLIRDTDWEYQWPWEHNRVRYLYRLSDADILRAMTGVRATVPEWTASNLEQGPVMSFTRNQWKNLTREGANKAFGYNASTLILSNTPVKVNHVPGTLGVEIPVTYRAACSAWEYDADGKLLGWWNMTNRLYFIPKYPGCKMVEFTLGTAGRNVDYKVVNTTTEVDPLNNVRVYVSPFSVLTGQLVGEMVDVTGDDTVYYIENGLLFWKKLDPVNQRGVLLFNTKCLGYSFELDHIDHSLSFAQTHIYDGGGLIFPTAFANYALWLNGHPLIDNVDWFFENGSFYIINKQFVVEGPQQITFRADQFHPDQELPVRKTELGFVDGGVIGRFPRYNLRDDRVTRCVIGGRLFRTADVPCAEQTSPSDLWDTLNGLPYMVKHTYTPVWYVEEYNNFPDYELAQEVDKRVSEYLTLYAEKPNQDPVIHNQQDKYRLFSPFLSVVVNAILNRLLVLPALKDMEEGYTDRFVRDQVASYLWWLKYDPVPRKFDLRYFAVMPYANYGLQTITSDEMIFIRQVNDLFLDSVCQIEGHFEVNDNVR